MTKKAVRKAESVNKIAKEQWAALVEILEDNYSIKSRGNEELFLSIPNEDEADIEVFLSGSPAVHTFHVQLWYFDLPDNYQHLRVKNLDTLRSVIMHIDEVLKAVKNIRKYG